MKKLTGLTIFFPFYNDAGTVKKAIKSAYYFGKKITNNLEVIAIHGGKSTDQTLNEIKRQKQIYKKLIIVDKTNNWEGYGVIKYGFMKATKDWIFYTDGDLQYQLEDFEKLVIKQLESGADIVNGYKLKRQDDFFRKIFGNIYRLFTKIFNLPIRDLDCDFRLIRKKFVKNIDLKAHDSSILLELIFKLKKQGAKFAEVGVKHYPRAYGYSSFNIWQLTKEKILGDFKVWYDNCLKTELIIGLFFIFLFIFLVAISLQRFFIFQVFYDFGYFVHVIWQLSRFKLAYINDLVVGKIIFLGDHFNPSLILLAPLFWFTSNPIILLLEQAIVTFLNAIIIFLYSVKKNLGRLSSLIITFVFVMFPGTTNPLLTDWHPEPTAALFLLLFIYLFTFTQNKKLPFICALIFLGFKESNPLTLIFVLFWLMFINKKRVKELGLLLIVSVFWFISTTNFIIPAISKNYYLYSPEISLSPVKIIQNIFGDPIKLRYLLYSATSFGFLPLLSGWAFIPALGELFMKIFPIKTIFANFIFTFHYHVYIGLFLTLATIWAVTNVKRRFINQKAVEFVLITLLLLTSVITARKYTLSPINLAINKTFWRELKPRTEMFEFINQVPKTGSVMSQNNLLAYLSARNDDLYFLSINYKNLKPNVIVFDDSPGQPPNNYWESQPEKLELIKKNLKKDTNYRRIKLANPHFFLFLKK